MTVDDVLEQIRSFLERWPNAEYGPAHVVLSDYNLEDEWIHECMGRLLLDLMAIETGHQPLSEHPYDELDATMRFLRTLLSIPEDDRVLDRD